MRRGQPRGPHLVEDDAGPPLGGLPSGFRPGKARPDHMKYSLFCHAGKVGENPCALNVKSISPRGKSCERGTNLPPAARALQWEVAGKLSISSRLPDNEGL